MRETSGKSGVETRGKKRCGIQGWRGDVAAGTRGGKTEPVYPEKPGLDQAAMWVGVPWSLRR